MISLLIVNYCSSALAVEAIRSARAASSVALQVVVVDNSCDAAEASALERVADRVIVSETNRGYAGGINLGRTACEGSVVVISNPDVVFAADAIDELTAVLQRGAAVAGPALFWDRGHGWRLPPGDLMTGPEKLYEVMASRSPALSKQRDLARFRARLRFWTASDPTPVRMLSGAVMAVRADDLDELGGFDERFRLYFEETDFLRRAAERRRKILYVPAARCRHLYSQSASLDEARSARLYAESEMKYLEKWNGPFVAGLLKRIERPVSGAGATELRPGDSIDLPEGDLVVEVSPLSSFGTAAGHFPAGRRVTVPEEVLSAFKGAVLYLRVVRRSGEVLGSYAQSRT
ncbi:MAG: glycosyltransferase family 2 protein [Thermoanaerobaculia bacterium]